MCSLSTALFSLPFFSLAELMQRSPPSLISLAGGAPNPNTFPFQTASFSISNGTTVEIGEDLMKRALQYSASAGYLTGHWDLTHISDAVNSQGVLWINIGKGDVITYGPLYCMQTVYTAALFLPLLAIFGRKGRGKMMAVKMSTTVWIVYHRMLLPLLQQKHPRRLIL